MTTTLFELASLRQVIDDALDASEGELSPELEQQLDAWGEAFDEKAERVALYVVEQEHLAGAARAEAKALQDRAQARQRRADSLKTYLHHCMERTGRMKVNGVLKTISLQRNPASVQCLTPMDENELRNIMTFAPKYVRHKDTWELAKSAIIEDAKAGTLDEDIARRVTVVHSLSLRIK